MAIRQDAKSFLLAYVKKHAKHIAVKKQKKKLVEDDNTDAPDAANMDEVEEDVEEEEIGGGALDDFDGIEDDELFNEDDVLDEMEEAVEDEEIEEAEDELPDDTQDDIEAEEEETIDDIEPESLTLKSTNKNYLVVPEYYRTLSMKDRLSHLHQITQSKAFCLYHIQDKTEWQFPDASHNVETDSTNENGQIQKPKRARRQKKEVPTQNAISIITKECKNLNFVENRK